MRFSGIFFLLYRELIGEGGVCSNQWRAIFTSKTDPLVILFGSKSSDLQKKKTQFNFDELKILLYLQFDTCGKSLVVDYRFLTSKPLLWF